MLPNIKGSKLLLREIDNLVKAIGECKSKAEEDRIIAQEVDTLKQRLNDPKLDKSRGREYMVRIIYCEMLGHDVGFSYIHCLQFASDANLLTKKAAYLALTQLMDYTNELVLLLVNTLLSDLKSDNFITVCTALVVTTKLIGPDLINAVYPVVVEKLSHSKESVRKKAIMVLHHFHRLDPNHTGPLAGVEVERHFRTMLCDKDPGVMCAALCALHDLVGVNPAPYRNLIPSLTSILKQVSEHRLPKAYDYHRFPAPFIQIKLLKVLAKLGAGDKASSDNMMTVIQATLKRAHGGHTIGNGIVYEAVRTIIAIYPNPALLAAAADSVSTLLKSTSHNLKYCGLDALAGITRISPMYAQEHQVAVIDCLEDPDDTLKLKTLELLVTMTKANNVEVIVERLIGYLRGCSDEHVRKHIATNVAELAERYAPDTTWFIGIVAEVFELGGEQLEPSLAHNLMRLIAEQDAELHQTAVSMFLELLGRPIGKPLPDILLTTVCWVLGEYGSLAAQLTGVQKMTVAQVIDRLCAAVISSQPSATARAYLISAVAKLAAAVSGHLTADADELLTKAGSSRNVELQQRSKEARALLSGPHTLASSVLPIDAACEEFDSTEMAAVRDLSFLDWYVNDSLAGGAQPYDPPAELISAYDDDDTLEALGLPGPKDKAAGSRPTGSHGLRFNAYERVEAPAAGTAAATTVSSPGFAVDDFLGMSGVTPAAAGSSAPAAAATSVNPAKQAVPSGPQLTLKAPGGRKWGPSDYGASTSGNNSIGAPYVGPTPTSAAVTSINSSSSTQHTPRETSSSASRALTEKDRLAASIFGGSTSSTSSTARFGIRSGASTTPRNITPPRTAAPIADLLGYETLPAATSATAAVSATSAKPTSDLEALLDLGAPEQMVQPSAPIPDAAAASTSTAATALDLLGDLTVPSVQPSTSAPSSMGISLLDVPSVFGNMPGGQLPMGLSAVSGKEAELTPMAPQQLSMHQHMGQPNVLNIVGTPAAGTTVPCAFKVPALATSSNALDPFEDLLG